MFATGFLASHLISRRRIKLLYQEAKEKEEQNRKDWQDMIMKMNHHGVIKEGSTASGLMNVILWAIGRCITSYRELYERKDWNTEAITTELQEIAMNEIALLHRKLNDYIESKRQILRDYNYKQE